MAAPPTLVIPVHTLRRAQLSGAAVWLTFAATAALVGEVPIAAVAHATGALGLLTVGLTLAGSPTRRAAAMHLGLAIGMLALTAAAWWSPFTLDVYPLCLPALPVVATYFGTRTERAAWTGISAGFVLAALALSAERGVGAVELATRCFGAVMIYALMFGFVRDARDAAAQEVKRSDERRRSEQARAVALGQARDALEHANEELARANEELLEKRAAYERANQALETQSSELVTARDAAMTRARQASDFLAHMSHEIRTPLHGVVGLADVLLGMPLERDARELVESLRSSGELLRRLVDEVLDLARIESGRLELHVEPVDLSGVVEDVADLFASQAAQKGLELAVQLPPAPLPRMLADSTRIRQMAGNLVGNAIKFTESGYVLLSLDGPHEVGELEFEFAIEVVDTGPGIPAAVQSKLFLPFERGAASTQTAGTGLGLAITQHLAHAMGGEVSVTSHAGMGSTFHASFRVSVASDRAFFDSGEFRALGTRILLLETNATVADAFKQVAASAQVEVVIVHSVETALPHLARGGFVAALIGESRELDLEATVRALRAPSRERAVPLVLGFLPTSHAIARRLVEEGLVDHTTLKPVRRSRLLAMFSAIRGKKRTNTTLPRRRAAPPVERRALVVDDDAVNRRIAKLILGRFGWTVDDASSVAEGQARLETAVRYQAVLIDLHLADGDGIEVARHATKVLPISERPWPIVFSASVFEDDRARARDAGIIDFVPKPLETSVLQAALENAEQHWQRNNEVRSTPAEIPAFDVGAVQRALGQNDRLLDEARALRSLVRQLEEATAQQDAERRRAVIDSLVVRANYLGARNIAARAATLRDRAPDAARDVREIVDLDAAIETQLLAFARAIEPSGGVASSRTTLRRAETPYKG